MKWCTAATKLFPLLRHPAVLRGVSKCREHLENNGSVRNVTGRMSSSWVNVFRHTALIQQTMMDWVSRHQKSNVYAAQAAEAWNTYKCKLPSFVTAHFMSIIFFLQLCFGCISLIKQTIFGTITERDKKMNPKAIPYDVINMSSFNRRDDDNEISLSSSMCATKMNHNGLEEPVEMTSIGFGQIANGSECHSVEQLKYQGFVTIQ
ncbi:hypothetical protein TRVL_08370 [Trypanosoma vivax]|uniref:Uncharacterized protein n=1 Tax=Trypanosoma vivax (strain Y486) TaxID=1055687 RepID=G0TYU4_TRYVY|nr:hypothetical protein TRVL_08370 [Trypanosoma vivax]CCC49144.1 conserved hypothetical protein [Trypanosoma vivax Y486]